jgi:hypothetical protein
MCPRTDVANAVHLHKPRVSIPFGPIISVGKEKLEKILKRFERRCLRD